MVEPTAKPPDKAPAQTLPKTSMADPQSAPPGAGPKPSPAPVPVHERKQREVGGRGIFFRRKEAAKDPMTDTWATYVTLPGAGLSHTIQLRHREEEPVQEAGRNAPRYVAVQGSGLRIEFFEGQFATDDPDLMRILETDPKYRFGIDFDIDPRDPTGYWRNCPDVAWRPNGRYQLEVEKSVTVKRRRIDDNIRVGARQINDPVLREQFEEMHKGR